LSYGPSIWQQALNSNALFATRKGFMYRCVGPCNGAQTMAAQAFREL
jgi:hypothetical protein